MILVNYYYKFVLYSWMSAVGYIWLAMSGQSGTTVSGNIEYIYWLVKDDEFDDDSWLNLVEIDFINFVMNILFFGN
jgi:hypothetical protein